MASRSDSDGRIDVSIWGISDLEMLAIVDDLADEQGWTATRDVRLQLGENLDRSYRSGVGSRIAWMRRYGWLERNPDQAKEHRLTQLGHLLLENPKFTKGFETALDRLNPAQRMQLTRHLARGGYNSVDEIRTAMRREWTRALRGSS